MKNIYDELAPMMYEECIEEKKEQNKKYWKGAKENGTYNKKYQDFMYNPDNIQNCLQCPHCNDGYGSSTGAVGPCGQQQCWVIAHTK